MVPFEGGGHHKNNQGNAVVDMDAVRVLVREKEEGNNANVQLWICPVL